DKDGRREGYDIELLKRVTGAVNLPVIASGGAGKLEHFYQAIIEGGADAVLAASIFHYGIYTIREVKEYLSSRGVPVRI
ncbi:MAG: HisA/HisF-related TIM barrel protein, partial [Nitrososphaerota archaeon]